MLKKSRRVILRYFQGCYKNITSIPRDRTPKFLDEVTKYDLCFNHMALQTWVVWVDCKDDKKEEGTCATIVQGEMMVA